MIQAQQKRKKMTHELFWHTIEKLARTHGLTRSGLAKLSGLDATTFNKSKQFSPDGTPRWPSCGTMVKVINALNLGVRDLVSLFPAKSDEV